MRQRSSAWLRANPFVLVIMLAAFVTRLVWSDGYSGLTNKLGYDPNVYFQAGQALAAGELPYRDFTLVHPPGIAVLLAPFSLVADLAGDAKAFVLARLTFMVLGAVGSLLIYLVAKRVGTVAAVVAGFAYCVQPGLVYTERTPYLEVFAMLATLSGLLVLNQKHVSQRIVMLAGALFGIAVATKLWSIVPLLVIVVAMAVLQTWKQAAVYLASAAAVATAIMLPFFIAAPSQMFQMIVLDQVGRDSAPGRGIARLGLIYGIDPELEPTISTRLALVLLAGTVVVLVLVWIKRSQARVWVILCATQLVVAMSVPTFFWAYKTFYAAGTILVFATLGQIVWDPLRRAYARGARVVPIVGVGALSLLLISAAGFTVTKRQADPGTPLPVAQLTEVVKNGRCVTADSGAYQTMSNSLSRSLDNGCPALVDITGTLYGMSVAEYEQTVANYYNSGDYVILGNPTGYLSAKAIKQVIDGRPIVMTTRGKSSGYNKFTVYGPRS